MEVTSIPPSSLTIARLALESAIPGLTDADLEAALRGYRPEHGDDQPVVAPGSLLTVQQVADRLSCHKGTIWRLIAAGRLPRVLLGKRSARVPEAAVAALAEGGSADAC